MTYDLHTYVLRGHLPSIDTLQQRTGGRVVLRINDLSAADGFIQAVLDGVETGFELFVHPITDEDRESYRESLAAFGTHDDELLPVLLATDLDFAWACNANDAKAREAAQLLASALADLAGGWLRDPQTSEMRKYVRREVISFEFLGNEGDEVRILRAPAFGYSIALAGHPRIAPSPADGFVYDLTVALDDLPVQHSFRLNHIPATPAPQQLAVSMVESYRSRRSAMDARVKPLPSAVATPGVIAGAHSIYSLRNEPTPTMEQLWVALHPADEGYSTLYHTTRFRNSDVNTIAWGHLRSSFIDQHSWDPGRDSTVAVWPESAVALPGVALDLTEAAWAEARRKATEMGDLSKEQQATLMAAFREFSQEAYPPRLRINELVCDTVRSAFRGVPERAARVLLRGLDECKTRHDLRGWLWQCAWAIGHRTEGAH